MERELIRRFDIVVLCFVHKKKLHAHRLVYVFQVYREYYKNITNEPSGIVFGAEEAKKIIYC